MFPDLPPRVYEALKALCCLAKARKPLRAHEIAAATALPPAQTAKLLQEMTWAGFVESRRGTTGGFWLVKPAKAIRVAAVLDFFAHRGPSRYRKDPLVRALAQATKQCRKELERVTVWDLTKLAAPAKAAGSRRENRGQKDEKDE